MKIKIVSFHWDKIPDTVRLHQKMVFDHFGIAIEQVITGLAHYDAIDKWISENEFDVMVLFDGDCIPLNKDAIDEYVNIAVKNHWLVGAIQNANHIKDSLDYIGPGFMVLTNIVYNMLGRPSFHDNERSDCGQELTHEAWKRRIGFIGLPVTHVMDKRWKLAYNTPTDPPSLNYFGIGTTYDRSIFHAFESRMNSNAIGIFERKCLEVISK
jgi:hypothetical protein